MVSAVAVVRTRLGGILDLADKSDSFRELASRLEDRQRLTVADATAGARAFAWSALVTQNARTVALVAPSEDRARRWRAELAGWLGEERVLAFPERESMPFEASAPSGTSVHQRLLTLWRLATAQAPVAVVTSLRALLEHTIPPEELARRGRTLRAGDRLSSSSSAMRLRRSARSTPSRSARSRRSRN
jgi:transcription-repair coupling factor (superfamily II helicase)